jgi:hypothetical protein
MVKKLAGDVNEDGKVNILDFAVVALQFHLKVKKP